MSDCQSSVLIGSGRHEDPSWHPLNLRRWLSDVTASLYDKYPSFTNGKSFSALFPLTREAEGQRVCVCVGCVCKCVIGGCWWRKHLSSIVTTPPHLTVSISLFLIFCHFFSCLYLADGGLSLWPLHREIRGGGLLWRHCCARSRQ